MDYRIEKRDAFQMVCKRKRVGKPQSANATPDISAMWREFGADGTMEYKREGDTAYAPITGDVIERLPAGAYLVRYAETETSFAGADTTVVIAPGEPITVTFDSNGGTAVEAQTVSRNGTVTRPEGIRREGYQFAGWYRDPGFTASYDFTKPVTGNLTLYAKWVQDSGKDDPDDGKDDPQNPPSHACPSKEFHDLDVGAWYHEDTDFVLSHQLMKGTEEAIFSPDEPLTRGMLVAILYRSEGEPQTGKAHTFTDVEPGAYYEKAVSWAQEQGVVKGVSETEFAPNDPITREQIAAILYRFAGYKGRDLSAGENTNILSYSDFDHISEYAIPALQWAAGMGVICGKTEATLNPQDSATRAEIAALLHRFLEQK